MVIYTKYDIGQTILIGNLCDDCVTQKEVREIRIQVNKNKKLHELYMIGDLGASTQTLYKLIEYRGGELSVFNVSKCPYEIAYVFSSKKQFIEAVKLTRYLESIGNNQSQLSGDHHCTCLDTTQQYECDDDTEYHDDCNHGPGETKPKKPCGSTGQTGSTGSTGKTGATGATGSKDTGVLLLW